MERSANWGYSKWIVDQRKLKGISQIQLARTLGVIQGQLSNWELSRNPVPTEHLWAMEIYFGCKAVQVPGGKRVPITTRDPGVPTWVAACRARKGWSQAELGSQMTPPVSAGTVSQWENQKTRVPKIYFLQMLGIFKQDPTPVTPKPPVGPLSFWVKSNRERLGLTQRALARQIGRTSGCVWQWENDRAAPNPKDQRALEGIFGCMFLVPPTVTPAPTHSEWEWVKIAQELKALEKTASGATFRRTEISSLPWIKVHNTPLVQELQDLEQAAPQLEQKINGLREKLLASVMQNAG